MLFNPPVSALFCLEVRLDHISNAKKPPKLSFCRERTRCGRLLLRQRAFRRWFWSSGTGLLHTSGDTYVASSARWRSAAAWLKFSVQIQANANVA